MILLLLFPLAWGFGCGGDDQADTASTQAPPATAPAEDGPRESGGGAAESRPRPTPEGGRAAADLRSSLRSGGGGAGGGWNPADVERVEIGRTTVTVHTNLSSDSDAEAASSMCAQTRRFLAQQPALNSGARVVITGLPRGRPITEC